MRNSNYNQNYDQSYYRNTDNGGKIPGKKRSSNTGLVIAVAILASVAIAACCVRLVFTANIIGKDDSASPTQTPVQTQPAEPSESPVAEPTQMPTPSPAPTQNIPVSVEKTMYVDCNVSITLRKEPHRKGAEIQQIPVGEAVYAIEYVNDEFARITYNGMSGYVMKQYLSDTCPYVWYYDEYEVENFAEDVLYAHVNAVNTGDFGYLSGYLRGEALQKSQNSFGIIREDTQREEVINVSCHSVKLISKTQVTVVRNSTIRVYKKDGTVRDAVETYITTVENTDSGMYVTSFEAA